MPEAEAVSFPAVIPTWVPSPSLGPLTDAWIEIGAQLRQMGDAGDQPLGRLLGRDRGPDRVRADTTVDGVMPRTVQAPGLELDHARGQRSNFGHAIQFQGGGDAGNRRAYDGLTNVKVTQIDLDRQSERTAAAACVAFGLRQADEIQPLGLKLVYQRGPLQQLPWETS